MTHIGDAIRRLRGDRALRSLACEGLSAGYLSDIEHGRRRGPGGLVKLERLARVLGADVGVLLLALELDDGIRVKVEGLSELARGCLRRMAAGATLPETVWHAIEGALIPTQEGP